MDGLMSEERSPSPWPSVRAAPATRRGKLGDLDGTGGIVFLLTSGFSLCFLVWDNVEPLAAAAGASTVPADELLVGEERERSPSPVSSPPGRGKLRDLDGMGAIVFFLTTGFSLCFLVWDNVEPLEAAANVPTEVAVGVDDAVSTGLGEVQPARARRRMRSSSGMWKMSQTLSCCCWRVNGLAVGSGAGNFFSSMDFWCSNCF